MQSERISIDYIISYVIISVQQQSFLEIAHEIICTAILSLLLIQHTETTAG